MRLLPREIQLQEEVGCRRANIACRDHGYRQIRPERPCHHSQRLNQSDLRQQVLHEVSSPQEKRIESGNRFEFFLEIVQPDDWAHSFRFIRADARESNNMCYTAFPDRRGQDVRHAFLVSGDIRRTHIGWDHRVYRLRAGKRSFERAGVSYVSNDCLRALMRKMFEAFCVSPQSAHLLSSCKHFLSCRSSSFSRGANNYEHVLLLAVVLRTAPAQNLDSCRILGSKQYLSHKSNRA